jgi:tetratricopeptide (TPR) repeat protein
MKKIVLMLAIYALGSSIQAQDLPVPSPKSRVEQRVGVTDFAVEYARPSANGRKIMGELVKYGELWRTGANKATMIEFSTPANIGGTQLPAGKYSIFTTPKDEGAWMVHINKNTELWGTGDFQESENAASFEVKASKSEHVESMLIYFDNLKKGSANLILAWENTRISIPIEVDYIEMSIANIDKALAAEKVSFRAYINASRFYLDHNLDAAKALEWAKKSVEMEKHFWNLKTLSEAYANAGDYKNAVAIAEESKTLSIEAKYDSYIKENENNIAKWTPLIKGSKKKK